MSIEDLKNRNFEQEFQISTSRSGGPGGQHVNKTETKVELRFNIPASEVLNEDERQRLLQMLQSRLTTAGDLILTSQESRSQLKNRELVVDRFYEIIHEALKVQKKRKKRRPSKAFHEKRLKEKKQRADKKQQRKPPEVT